MVDCCTMWLRRFRTRLLPITKGRHVVDHSLLCTSEVASEQASRLDYPKWLRLHPSSYCFERGVFAVLPVVRTISRHQLNIACSDPTQSQSRLNSLVYIFCFVTFVWCREHEKKTSQRDNLDKQKSSPPIPSSSKGASLTSHKAYYQCFILPPMLVAHFVNSLRTSSAFFVSFFVMKVGS